MSTLPKTTHTLGSLATEFRAALGCDLFEVVDLDMAGESYLLNARRETALARWEADCPSDLKETDWNRPSLVPYAASIARIRGHKPESRGIIATGPTGRGKSRAMWSLMRRLAVDELREVRCWHATDFFATLQAQVSFGRDEASGWVETVARRKIVFLDDLGQEALLNARADWARSWFFRFLDIRVGEKLPLYVTTNMRGEDIAKTGGASGNLRSDPLLRRLLDLCEVVKF